MIYLVTLVVSSVQTRQSVSSTDLSGHTHTHTYILGYYNPHAHIFCDCDICQDQWSGMDFSDLVGSDSDGLSDNDEEEPPCSHTFGERYNGVQMLGSVVGL